MALVLFARKLPRFSELALGYYLNTLNHCIQTQAKVHHLPL